MVRQPLVHSKMCNTSMKKCYFICLYVIYQLLGLCNILSSDINISKCGYHIKNYLFMSVKKTQWQFIKIWWSKMIQNKEKLQNGPVTLYYNKMHKTNLRRRCSTIIASCSDSSRTVRQWISGESCCQFSCINGCNIWIVIDYFQ